MKKIWKRYNLKKAREFQEIIKRRRKIFNKNFIIYYSFDNKLVRNCRFGISIPQKIVKKAVLRNKYKRQIKSIIIDLIKKEKSLVEKFISWNFIILIKDKFKESTFEKNKEELKKIFYFFKLKMFDNNFSKENELLFWKK